MRSFLECHSAASPKRSDNFHRINADDWLGLDAQSFSERAAKFYESSENYIFGILSANPRPQAVVEKLDRFNPRIMTEIRAHPGKRFFEFGGGTGVFCEIAARLGKDVYYMELPGIGLRIRAMAVQKIRAEMSTQIEAVADVIHLPGRYDIVYTDAVIEHLPHALQVDATKAIGKAVDAGGLLIFLVDLSGPTVDDPMHHHVNIAELHDLLHAEGLRCEAGSNEFCSIWRRP